MFTNYIKVALRNLRRHKLYSLIIILGLAIGLTACILILLYLQWELSYDRWNEKADRIYQIALHGILGENEFDFVVSCAPIGQTLVNEFPEVESATRIRNYGYPVLRYQDKVLSEERFFRADTSFFDIFAVHFIMGDPGTCLKEPNSVVLTESTWRKYFGSENPIGKILNSDNRTDWKVTAVIKDFPKNSHFHPDFLASFSTNLGDQNIWVSNNYHTYILL